MSKLPLKSTVTSASPNTKSLRTTIPEGAAEFLKLEDGDKVEWTMEVNGERYLKMKKAGKA